MNIRVLSPGLLTSLQDGGRFGHSAIGVGSAGAMDGIALRVANILVDNAQNAAALEITLRGPRLRFEDDTLIAIAGAQIDMHCGDQPVPMWRPLLVRAGAELTFGGMRRGAHAYLAVGGGIDVAPVLGSRSTDINAALGPIPRALIAGDTLRCPSPDNTICAARSLADRGGNRNVFATKWSLDSTQWFDRYIDRPIRVIVGTHFDALDMDSQCALFGAEFRIGVDSNRVGCRLEDAPLALSAPLELVSAGVAPGTLQLPPNGIPIALGAEAPTTGGYPRIAHVITVDQPRLAQLRPGDRVRFVQTDLADAQSRYLERERELQRVNHFVRWRLRDPW